MHWNQTALAVERKNLASIERTLLSLPRSQLKLMQDNAARTVERMLYTTFEFSPLSGRAGMCAGCSPHRTDVLVTRGSKRGHASINQSFHQST